jgi:hypothetical protein
MLMRCDTLFVSRASFTVAAIDKVSVRLHGVTADVHSEAIAVRDKQSLQQAPTVPAAYA